MSTFANSSITSAVREQHFAVKLCVEQIGDAVSATSKSAPNSFSIGVSIGSFLYSVSSAFKN